MAGNSVAKIGVGAPLATGGVMVAAAGTTLPIGVSSATTSFVKLGYVGDDGLRPSGTRTSTDIFDWGGDLIYSPQENHSTQFQIKLLAAFDDDVLSEVFGTDFVTTVGSLTCARRARSARLSRTTWAGSASTTAPTFCSDRRRSGSSVLIRSM